MVISHSFPIKNGDFPRFSIVFCNSLPEANSGAQISQIAIETVSEVLLTAE